MKTINALLVSYCTYKIHNDERGIIRKFFGQTFDKVYSHLDKKLCLFDNCS